MSTPAIPPQFPLKGTMVRIGNDKVRVKWEFDPEHLEKFVQLATLGKHVMQTPPQVFDMLYGDMLSAAQKDQLLVSPQQPEVKAYQQQHGENNNIQFFAGSNFFQGELHKYSTYYMFSLFNAPGALSALDMQLKGYKAATSQAPETPEQKAGRLVGSVNEMLSQLDKRRDTPPKREKPEPNPADATEVVKKKEDVADGGGVPPMPEGAVVKEEPME